MAMSRARARELALPVLLVVLILGGTVGASLALNGIETDRRDRVVDGRQERLRAIVDGAFRAPLERLALVAAGVASGGGGDQREFATLAGPMLRTPEVGAVGLVERVPQRERAAWERRTGVRMKAAAQNGDAPAPPRAVHYAVRAVAAKADIPPGTDLGADPIRVAAMRRAAALGEPTFTPPVTVFGRDQRELVQLVAFHPVDGGPTGSRFVSATFTFDALADRLGETLPQGTSAVISDGAAPLVRLGSGRGETRTRRLTLGGRNLEVRTSVAYDEGTPWDELVLAIGLIGALGVGVLTTLARRRERRATDEVAERLAERADIEAALVRERGFSATLIAALPDGFVAADNRGVIVVNDAMCELTGFPRSELMGRLFPHGFWPEESLLEVQRLRDHAAETGTAEMELTLRTKDDRRIPVLVSASRMQGRHGPVELYLVRDNRERAEATRMLTESEAQLRSLANAARDMVVKLSLSERIEWVSPSAQQVLGFAPDELIGRRLNDVFADEGLGRLGAAGGVHRLRRKDGRRIWAETTVTPIVDADGALTGMRTSVRDVTEREEGRAALQRSESRLRTMLQVLPDTIVFMIDADRRFVLAEGGGFSGTGWSSADVEGRTVDEVLADPSQADLLPFYDAVLAGRTGEVSHRSAIGREYLTRFVPLPADDGTIEGAMVVAMDVTELRTLQARQAGQPAV